MDPRAVGRGSGHAVQFTFGHDRKAERFLALADERLAEAQALLDRDSIEEAEATLDRYEDQLDRAVGEAEAAEAGGEADGDMPARAADATLKHLEVLAGVYERVPVQAKPAIARAMVASRHGHDEALRAISDEKLPQVVAREGKRLEELEGKGSARPAGRRRRARGGGLR
ncbi:MAG: DUF5667 domain-containing protein [Actinomycetota bacterium]